jgi:hypothetical protein
MPFERKLEKTLAGFAAESVLPGEDLSIETSGFHTSSEGEPFIRILEGLSQRVFSVGSIVPSQVHHFLIVAARDGTLTVYVNELEIRLKIQAQTARQAGEIAWSTDIADIVEVDIGVEIPSDCGVCLLFSAGWRKGLFFDFDPLAPKAKPRNYAIGPVLAAAWCAVMFQERFTLSEEQWGWILGQRCFLFIGLSPDTLQQIIIHSEHKWGFERLAPQIISSAKAVANQLPELAGSSPLIAPQRAAIEVGIKHFIEGETFSAACVLYPAVEGILRGHYSSHSSARYPRQDRLIETAKLTGMAGRHAYCLLMIERFDAFLRQVIFADFDWQKPDGVSRHTIAHGAVAPSGCDELSVARVVLTIHHLMFSLQPPIGRSTEI